MNKSGYLLSLVWGCTLYPVKVSLFHTPQLGDQHATLIRAALHQALFDAESKTLILLIQDHRDTVIECLREKECRAWSLIVRLMYEAESVYIEKNRQNRAFSTLAAIKILFSDSKIATMAGWRLCSTIGEPVKKWLKLLLK